MSNKTAGRPKEFDSEFHLKTDKKTLRQFKQLCSRHEAESDEPMNMSKALRGYMQSCLQNGMILIVLITLLFATGCVTIKNTHVGTMNVLGSCNETADNPTGGFY